MKYIRKKKIRTNDIVMGRGEAVLILMFPDIIILNRQFWCFDTIENVTNISIVVWNELAWFFFFFFVVIFKTEVYFFLYTYCHNNGSEKKNDSCLCVYYDKNALCLRSRLRLLLYVVYLCVRVPSRPVFTVILKVRRDWFKTNRWIKKKKKKRNHRMPTYNNNIRVFL